MEQNMLKAREKHIQSRDENWTWFPHMYLVHRIRQSVSELNEPTQASVLASYQIASRYCSRSFHFPYIITQIFVLFFYSIDELFTTYTVHIDIIHHISFIFDLVINVWITSLMLDIYVSGVRDPGWIDREWAWKVTHVHSNCEQIFAPSSISIRNVKGRE